MKKKLAATSPAFSAAHTAHRCKRKQPQARFIAASHLLPKKCTYPTNRCRTHFSRMHKAAALVVCALAATALTPPQRAVRRQTRLRARTAEGMAPGWKATTDETGAYELIPASYEYQYQEIFVEIPRTAESPGLGVLLEQFGTLDAQNGGLTLIAGLVEDGNAANAGVDLLPGDSIVKAGGTRVECLDYDATVDALMALPPAPAPAGLMAVWKSTSELGCQHRVDGVGRLKFDFHTG